MLQVSLRYNKVYGALGYSACSKKGFLYLRKIHGLAREKLQGAKDMMKRAEYHMGVGCTGTHSCVIDLGGQTFQMLL